MEKLTQHTHTNPTHTHLQQVIFGQVAKVKAKANDDTQTQINENLNQNDTPWMKEKCTKAAAGRRRMQRHL